MRGIRKIIYIKVGFNARLKENCIMVINVFTFKPKKNHNTHFNKFLFLHNDIMTNIGFYKKIIFQIQVIIRQIRLKISEESLTKH